MRAGQTNSIKQVEELFESSKTNALHLELSKYVYRNINAVESAIKNGWTRGADEHDTEYMEKYIALRDKFFPDGLNDKPDYSLTADVIKCGYDFKNETGSMIIKSIKNDFKFIKALPENNFIPTESIPVVEEILKQFED